jgi:molecular chaperone DnaK
LVFDFGGGTFDAALIKATEGVMQVKDTEGDNFLGGKNLDEAIVDQIILPHLQSTYSIDTILNDPEKREILRKGVKRFAEDAKIQMSFKDTTTISSNLGDIPFEDEYGAEIEIDIPITLKDMERVLAPIFQKAIDITKDLLLRNNLSGNKLDSLILVGGPTHSSILRRMLKEQITENVDTFVDPMTVVAQGAALFASTVDITVPKPQPPANKIVLDLKYPPHTVEPTEMVFIKMLTGKSKNIPNEIFVELKRSDGSWSTIKQVNDKKTTIFDVELIPEKVNFFEIYVTDDKANLLDYEPKDFSIMPVDPPSPPLPYHIGIAKYFEDKEKDLFFPVKGLEKNKEIPATGIANGLKTRSSIEKGNANHRLRIPIYQGDYNAEGSELSLNNLVYEVIITGETLPGTLPEGSIVDITIKIDESQRMRFNAYFPYLDYSEELEIEIQQEKAPSATNLAKDIADAKQKAQKANRNDVVQELDKLDEQLKHGAASDDNKLAIQKGIRDALLKLLPPPDEEKWKSVENELNGRYDELTILINHLGEDNIDKNDKAQLEDIRRKKPQIVAEKNIKEAKKLIKDINTLIITLDPDKYKKILLAFHFQFDSIAWSNPEQARQSITEGMTLVRMGCKDFELALIVKELFKLIIHIDPKLKDLLG